MGWPIMPHPPASFLSPHSISPVIDSYWFYFFIYFVCVLHLCCHYPNLGLTIWCWTIFPGASAASLVLPSLFLPLHWLLPCLQCSRHTGLPSSPPIKQLFPPQGLYTQPFFCLEHHSSTPLIASSGFVLFFLKRPFWTEILDTYRRIYIIHMHVHKHVW